MRRKKLHERATLAVTPMALVIAQVPNVKPDGSKAPGGKGLQDAINVFAFTGFWRCRRIPARRCRLGRRRSGW